MKNNARFLAALLSIAALAGCGGGSSSDSGSTNPQSATVNLVVHDTPSTKITVLSFQLQITGAELQPGNVSLLPKPVTVDLAQLVTDTSLLASTVVNSTTFTSLTMTFANPQVTIVNNSGAPIVTPTQTCSIGAVCTFTPRLNSASVTISSGVFPITVSASSSTGLSLDLSIPDLLQSDLSVTFANGTSVNLSVLPQPTDGVQAQLDNVLGAVQSVSSGQVQIKTAVGDTLVLNENSSTQYNFPKSICAANNASCLAANQIVTADLSLLANGGLQADSLTYADSAGATVAQGAILSLGTNGAPTFQMLVLRALPNTSGFAPGEIVDITVQSGAAFSVASPNYPAVSGGFFATTADLTPGQKVLLEITGNTPVASDGNAAFSTNLVTLESSQIAGQVTAVNSSAQSFALTNVWTLFSSASPAVTHLQVQTGSQTSFVNLSPSNLSAITVGSYVSTKGSLFLTAGTSEPTMSSLQVTGRN